MDAFFVSVEELFDPSLKGKPVVVGGRPNERGVVSAASYAARKFGVHSAMPLRTAYKLCPQAIFVDGHPERYRDYSHKVYDVLQSFSPLVEMASIDEAYLDMTGTERLYGPPLRAAHLLHQRMKAETGLNCSIGIAASRLVAKIGSDQAKPNGVLWVIPGQEAGLSRAARRAQSSRRGQSDGEAAERARHPQGRRPGAPRRSLPRAALRQVGPGAGRQIARPGCRRLVRHRNRRGRWPEIHQPRAHLFRGHRRPGADRIHPGAPVRNGGPPFARAPLARAHHPAQAALLRFLDLHARAFHRPRHRSRYRAVRGDPRALPPQLENGSGGAPAGGARFFLVRGRRAVEPDRRRETPEMEPGAGGRRPAARQVRRVGRIAGRRPARQFPRAHARKPRSLPGRSSLPGKKKAPH